MLESRYRSIFSFHLKNPFFENISKIIAASVSVSIGFELIKIYSKYDNIITRIVAAPGL